MANADQYLSPATQANLKITPSADKYLSPATQAKVSSNADKYLSTETKSNLKTGGNQPGVDTALATQIISRGGTAQKVASLSPATQSYGSTLAETAKNTVLGLAGAIKDQLTPPQKVTPLPPTPTNALGYGQGNNLNKENILPSGPTNALASLPKEDSVKFSLTEQPKFSQNFTGLQKIQNQVANEQGDIAYREQARQERVNQILIPAMYAGGVGAALEIGTAGTLAAAGKAALTTAADIGIFTGLQAVEDKLNIHLANYLPQEGTNQQQDNAKIVADILQVIGNGLLTHGIMKKAPAVATAFTKNTIEYYNLPREVNIPASVIKDIFKTGKLATPEQLDLFAKITGGDRAKINSAIQNGLDVTVPAEGVTRLVDKPYWAKIKEALKLSPTDEIVSSKQYGKPTENLKGLPAPTMAERMPTKIAELPPSEVKPTMADKMPQAVEPHQALIEKAKGKTLEEFVKAQPTVYRGEGGSNVAQGKALLAEGKHYASDAEYPKGFGKVGEYVLKPKAKVLDLGDSTFAEISQKLGIPERSYISPKELSAIAKEKGYDVLKYDGTYKSTGKTFNHTVDLTGDSYILKSQLTDIWNKANPAPTMAERFKQIVKPQAQPTVQPQVIEQKVSREQMPFGEGKDKVSRLEARMKGVLDNASEEYVKNLGLSTYKEMNDEVILHKAAEYATAHPDDVLKIISGELPEPKGIPKEALFVAISNAEGSPELYTKIATMSSTGLGQRMQLLSQIDADSPVKILGDIIKIKEADFTKRTGKTRKQIEKEVDKAVDAIAKPTKQNWADFVKEITCK